MCRINLMDVDWKVLLLMDAKIICIKQVLNINCLVVEIYYIQNGWKKILSLVFSVNKGSKRAFDCQYNYCDSMHRKYI